MCSVFRTLRLEEALSSRVHAWPVAASSAVPPDLDTESTRKVPAPRLHCGDGKTRARTFECDGLTSVTVSVSARRSGIEYVSQFLVAPAVEDERVLSNPSAERPTKTDARQQGKAKCKHTEEDLEQNTDKPG